MLLDYHIHSQADDNFSPLHRKLDILRQYVEHAQNRGVQEIGISDHCYRFAEFAPILGHLAKAPDVYPDIKAFIGRSFIDHLDEHVAFLQRAKAAGLPIKIGLEVDYIVGSEELISNILARYPWDYIIGSVHFLGLWGIDISPACGWPERDIDAVYTEYFQTWQRACASGLFDIMAHPDLVKKFGHRPSGSLNDYYQSASQAAAEAGVAIEVSSAGLHRQVGEIYPSLPLLQAFQQADVPITLASDAHHPHDAGLDVDKAAAWAQQAGYTSVCVFDARHPTMVPLG